MKRSVAPSQIPSGVQTPQEHAESDLVSPLLSSELKERLQTLGNEPHARGRLVSAIETLDTDRRKTSVQQREQALAVLLQEFANKYDPAVLSYDLYSAIVQSFLQARSRPEAATALQLAVVALTFVADDDSRAARYMESAAQLDQVLVKRIQSEENEELKSAVLTAHAVLTYFLNAGGGGYGIETHVAALLEIAESTSAALPATASIAGAALLLTLCTRGAVNELAVEWLPTLDVILNGGAQQPRLAAAKFVAVLIERADPDFLRAEAEEMLSDVANSLESISQQSVQKTGKRDKKAQNLLVKSVLKKCQHVLNPPSEEDLEKLEEENEIPHFVKSTISKNLGIRTWDALVVLDHLVWVFGPGVHSQLANNAFVRQILKREDVQIQPSEQPIYYDNEQVHQPQQSEPRRMNAVKRSQDLRKQQLRKNEDREMYD